MSIAHNFRSLFGLLGLLLDVEGKLLEDCDFRLAPVPIAVLAPPDVGTMMVVVTDIEEFLFGDVKIMDVSVEEEKSCC